MIPNLETDRNIRIVTKVAPSKTDSVSITRDFAGLEEDPQAAISQTAIVAAFDRLNIGVFEPELESPVLEGQIARSTGSQFRYSGLVVSSATPAC